MKNIQLRIDTPCGENWDHMSPTSNDRGRYCQSCKKTVVDFTWMTDQQILDWFSKPQETTCGRFEAPQLNRNLQRQRPPSRLGWWQYLLAGLLLSSEVSAQGKPAAPPVSQHDSSNRDDQVVGKMGAQIAPQNKYGLPDILRGRLLDATTNEPVPFASISITSHLGYAADAAGEFAIPRSALAGVRQLKITSVGYAGMSVDVQKTWSNKAGIQTLRVLRMEALVQGDMVITVVHRRAAKKIETILKDTLAYAGLAKKALSVYPNPIPRGGSVTLALRLDNPGTYSAQLFSGSGVLIQTIKVEGTEKEKDIKMDIPVSLCAGTYFIRLTHPTLPKAYTQEVVVL